MIKTNTLKSHELIKVLSQDECLTFVNTVFKLREHWTKRYFPPVLNIPMFLWTLGYATYLDGPEGHKLANQGMNELLQSNFSSLYSKVEAKLAEAMECDVRIDLNYALPGFHIYQGNPNIPLGLAFGGNPHFDTPHLRANFKFPFTDYFSFTLPILLPKLGGGLNYWIDIPEYVETGKWIHEVSRESRQWLTDNVRYLPYKGGAMAVHDCDILHQLANKVKTTEDDWRITLQGHGVFRGSYWMIYF
jgi:hypothetical protein